MAKLRPDAARTTLFQLEALAQVIRFGDFGKAASELGVADKHRLIKAVERLSENLGVSDLHRRIGDEPVGLKRLGDEADYLLGAVHRLEIAAAELGGRPILIRCTAYPIAIATFIASAVRRFEARSERTAGGRAAVRFTDLDGDNRREGGAGLLRPLVSGASDVVVAPRTDRKLDPAKFHHEPLYAWRLLAAINPDHPLNEVIFEASDGTPVISTEALVGWPLLTSPRGHRSRDLLNLFEPLDASFEVELETRDTSARVALGRFGDRVPVVAGDGVSVTDYNNAWPALVGSDGDVLGDTQEIYWRTDLSPTVASEVERLVGAIQDEAQVLRTRVGGVASA